MLRKMGIKINHSPDGMLRFGLQLTRSKGSHNVHLCRQALLSHR